MFASVVALAAACSQSGSASSTTTDPAPQPSATSDLPGTATTTSTLQEPVRAADEPPRTDLLAFANGAVVVSATGVTGNVDARAMAVIDGSHLPFTLVESAEPAVTVVFQMPAPTSFDRFAVPAASTSSGAPFRSVTIEGSSTGLDGPWMMLATTELTAGDGTTELEVIDTSPVSWIRLTLSDSTGGLGTYVFTELIGNGGQDDVPLVERFSGSWEVRPFARPDSPGRVLSLTQSGTVISGCLGELVVTGTVEGSVARALGEDPRAGRARALLIVAAPAGELIVAVTEDDRLEAGRGLVTNRGASCDAPDPEPPSCGDTVHILFDADSAEIRPSSRLILDDLFTGLNTAGVNGITIIGHTSTEGEEAYNQDLSERRAAAVVGELVARGLDPGLIAAEGRGESRPLVSPDLDEGSRSLNRRVEVSCSS